MDELGWFFGAIGFLLLCGVLALVVLVTLVVVAVLGTLYVVLEVANVVGARLRARAR
jgi:hypothetical protein